MYGATMKEIAYVTLIRSSAGICRPVGVVIIKPNVLKFKVYACIGLYIDRILEILNITFAKF